MSHVYEHIIDILNQQGITLIITRKRVKNINLRIQENTVNVSIPWHASKADITNALQNRLDWVISTHRKVINKKSSHAANIKNQTDPSKCVPLNLWGEAQTISLNQEATLKLYREELNNVMPQLFTKWQVIVGKTAAETRIKKMKTRWGSCNTKDKRIWLSIYLPEYPLECTEYVIVHELCHLHHANHSADFWQEVVTAMPNYKKWHNMLGGKRV